MSYIEFFNSNSNLIQEKDFLKWIDNGEQIVKTMSECPQLCSDITLEILQGKNDNVDLIQSEFKGLLNLLKLKHILFETYNSNLQKIYDANDIEKVSTMIRGNERIKLIAYKDLSDILDNLDSV